MADDAYYYKSPLVYVREACDGDIVLASRLRPADADEVYASHGLTPVQAVAGMLRSEGIRHAAVKPDGTVVAIYGVTVQSWGGEPWLLGSEEIRDIFVPFLRQSKLFIQRAAEHFGVLSNWVDVRNELSIRWIRWLGFTVGRAMPFGFEGRDFLPFALCKKCRRDRG